MKKNSNHQSRGRLQSLDAAQLAKVTGGASVVGIVMDAALRLFGLDGGDLGCSDDWGSGLNVSAGTGGLLPDSYSGAL